MGNLQEGNDPVNAQGDSPRPPPLRKRILPWRYLFLFFLLLMVAGLGGTYQYSTSPKFYQSYHIMKPYYNAWGKSSHHSVSCVECHYPPEILDTMWVKFQALSQLISYITRTYGSKPVAEVEDASCLRSGCHETRLLEGDLLYKGFVKFNHSEHLTERRAGKKLRCASCHSQVVVGTHMTVTEQSSIAVLTTREG
jgi:nitrate/TMAO reductase-like tetraheme cytochrome c subunit